MIIIDQIRQWIEQDNSVKRVAEDLQLTSELILLVRMIFADGVLRPEELNLFKQLCQTAFGIPEAEVANVIKYLQEFGYETSVSDAAAMFADMEMERKQKLMLHMLSIAKADDVIRPQEAELIRNVANLLGLSADDFTSVEHE